MDIRDGDYKIEGDGIWLKKDVLESYREQYRKEAHELQDAWNKDIDAFRYPFYLGKMDVLIDILKMFEPLEG